MTLRLIERIALLLRADAHGVVDALEERSLLLKQALRDAELDLLEKRAHVEALEREEERAIRLGDAGFDRDVRAQQLFGFEQLPFDDSGRFVMPEHLKELGKIEGGLYFQGAGAFFFVWNPAQLAQMGPEWKGAQASCLKLAAAARKGAAE